MEPARGRPSSRLRAGRFLAIPLIWGMELLPLRRSLLFTRAISRPGTARRLSPRAGGSRGAIGPTILSIDLPVAPVAILPVLARLSHRRGGGLRGAAVGRANPTPAKPTIGMIENSGTMVAPPGPAPAAGRPRGYRVINHCEWFAGLRSRRCLCVHLANVRLFYYKTLRFINLISPFGSQSGGQSANRDFRNVYCCFDCL